MTIMFDFRQVGSIQGRYILNICLHTGRIKIRSISIGAFLQSGETVLIISINQRVVGRLVDEWVVRVLEVELNLLSFLNHRIIPSVVDTQGHQINLFANDRPFFNGFVLLIEIMCEF